MKALLLSTAFVTIAIAASATIRTVNNNTPSPGQYSSLSAAVTAASAGDTLYIAPSPYNYNSLTLNKQLTIIGTGHKTENTNPSTAMIDDISFSGAVANVNGCKFIGLNFNQLTLAASITNIEVVRCKVRYRIFGAGNANYITVEGNFFEYQGVNLQPEYYSSTTDWVIKNNVFNGQIGQFWGYYGTGNIYVKNNLFLYSGNAFYSDNRYMTVINNIFYRASPQTGNTLNNVAFANNITYQCGNNIFTTGNGCTSNNNQENVNPMLSNFPNGGAYFSYSYDFTLQGGSPALNAGNDGKDIGLTGGDGYYQKYGIPAMPQMRSFSITSPSNGEVSPGGTIQVNLISTIKR